MHDLDIIKINECLVAKSLLTNVTKTNEHSNIAKFVYALLHTIPCFLFLPEKYQNAALEFTNTIYGRTFKGKRFEVTGKNAFAGSFAV